MDGLKSSRGPTEDRHRPARSGDPSPSPATTPTLFRDRVVELRRVPAGELLAHPRRWRTHPEAQRRALRELLGRVGIADAVLARPSPQGLVLIDGHLRRDLAPDTVLPVLVLDVTEAEADLLLASLDPVAQMARASQEALARLLSSAVLPRDLLQEVHRRYSSGRPRVGLVDPDAVPPRPRTKRVRPGQLWALGEHRVACGDATDPVAIRRLVGEARIDVLWTDPPYGVSYVGKTREALRIQNDDAHGLQALLEGAFAAVAGVLSPGARLYVCHPAGPASIIFGQAFSGAGWRLHQTLVWVKDRIVLGHADYHYRHEPILYGYRPGPGRWGRGHQGWYGGNEATSVLEVPRPAASRAHPTAKPVELIARCLTNSSGPRDLVLDPFGGSGSTLVACEQMDRRAFLLELDPAYCEVAIRRWEEFTGERAVVLDG